MEPNVSNPTSTALTGLETADAVLPRFDWEDGKKRKYLSFRLMGYGREEARRFAGVATSTIYAWRSSDPEFLKFEKTDLFTLRSQFAKQAFGLDFTRNLKLAMERDHQVLKKAVTNAKMTVEEVAYLHKIRGLYSATEFAKLEGFFAQLNDIGSFDEMILMIRRKNPDGPVQEAHSYQLPSIKAEYTQSPDEPSWAERNKTAAEEAVEPDGISDEWSNGAG